MKTPKYHRIFNYRKTLLPNEYLASLENGVQDIEAAKQKTGFTIGYPGWNLLYYSVLSHLDSDNTNIILETGTNIGCTTIMLCQALKDSGMEGHVYSIELEKDNHLKAIENLKLADVYNYATLICGDSVEQIEKVISKFESIRVAFLDGCHEQDHVVKEFELIFPRLTDTSLVFFDNTYKIADEGEDQRVNGALKIIMQRFGGNLINFENTSWFTPGQAIWQKAPFSND